MPMPWDCFDGTISGFPVCRISLYRIAIQIPAALNVSAGRYNTVGRSHVSSHADRETSNSTALRLPETAEPEYPRLYRLAKLPPCTALFAWPGISRIRSRTVYNSSSEHCPFASPRHCIDSSNNIYVASSGGRCRQSVNLAISGH